MALRDGTVAQVLELLAAREPAPGGGSAAALTGALAAALTEMVVAFVPTSVPGAGAAGGPVPPPGLGHDLDPDPDLDLGRDLDRARALRARLLALADQDTRSYRPVLDALALERSDPDRPVRLRAALAAASEVPLAIATAAAEVAELAAAAAPTGNAHLLGDAITAVVLAEAAARSAARLVEVNLADSPDDGRLAHVGAAARRAWAAREAVIGANTG